MRNRLWAGILLASGTLAGDAHAQSSSDVPDGRRDVACSCVPGTTHLEALDLVQFEVRPVELPGR